ncbi:hypothetical protein CXU17_12155 [Akkermansia muciniphila]|nr:hypothetical protein CXU17_12155 [Akkermansia muciniphila]
MLIPIGASLAATSGALTSIDPALSDVAGMGSLGVMGWVVTMVLKMRREDQQRHQEQLMAKDAKIDALMTQLINKCPSCELAKAANKSLIEED